MRKIISRMFCGGGQPKRSDIKVFGLYISRNNSSNTDNRSNSSSNNQYNESQIG